MPRKAQGTKRRKRDPERPKRAMTAYMVYVRDNIKTVTRDMGNAKRSEVIRECGARWNAMTQNQKRKAKTFLFLPRFPRMSARWQPKIFLPS